MNPFRRVPPGGRPRAAELAQLQRIAQATANPTGGSQAVSPWGVARAPRLPPFREVCVILALQEYGSYRPWEIENLPVFYVHVLLTHPRDEHGKPILTSRQEQAVSFKQAFRIQCQQKGLTPEQIADLWRLYQEQDKEANGQPVQ